MGDGCADDVVAAADGEGLGESCKSVSSMTPVKGFSYERGVEG